MATFEESTKVSSSVSEPYRMEGSAPIPQLYTPVKGARKSARLSGCGSVDGIGRGSRLWLLPSVHELKREARAIGDDTVP